MKKEIIYYADDDVYFMKIINKIYELVLLKIIQLNFSHKIVQDDVLYKMFTTFRQAFVHVYIYIYIYIYIYKHIKNYF